MHSYTKTIDVIDLSTKQHLSSIFTLEIYTDKSTLSDLTILNDGGLLSVGNWEDSSTLKVGETSTWHDNIVAVYENTASSYVVLVTHKLAVDNIDLSTR